MTALAHLVAVSRAVGATRARSEKIARLAEFLRRLETGEVATALAWLSGRLRQRRVGLGPAALREARAAPAPVPALALREADAVFERIAAAGGRGSAAERARLLAELFARATAPEQELLARLVVGELRQGALEGILLEAVARAAEVPAAELRRAVMLAGDLAEVGSAALASGAAALGKYRLELQRPLQPMLAQPAEDLDDALARLGEAALEWKLDGARVQVHKDGTEVRVFSRRGNEVTAAVPELVEAVRALPARRLLLDGEAIALRPDATPHPFQVTMRRFGRRLDVERLRREQPLSTFFFDLLHLDGEDLLDRPAGERFAALREAVGAELDVPRRVTADRAAAAEFLADALRRGHEGLMAKALDAPYEAGSRGSAWLKVKPAHTLDLVVLAVERGSGRRRGWLSNLHLGARDAASGQFVMLGKTFKGMTDAMLEWQTRELGSLATADDGWVVTVRPELVVEVAFNDVQASPHYPAGMALRFARVKRYRPDKSAVEADTLETVRAIFAGRRRAVTTR
jgi:DNA ligase-1